MPRTTSRIAERCCSGSRNSGGRVARQRTRRVGAGPLCEDRSQMRPLPDKYLASLRGKGIAEPTLRHQLLPAFLPERNPSPNQTTCSQPIDRGTAWLQTRTPRGSNSTCEFALPVIVTMEPSSLCCITVTGKSSLTRRRHHGAHRVPVRERYCEQLGSPDRQFWRAVGFSLCGLFARECARASRVLARRSVRVTSPRRVGAEARLCLVAFGGSLLAGVLGAV
jgi:hypothetical protein